MSQLRIDWSRKSFDERLDSFRYLLQTFKVPLRVLAAGLVSDDRQSFAQGRGEICVG